jgi:hypothetical protein
MGFLDDLENDMKMQAMIQAAKGPDGKPDPDAAYGALLGRAIGSGKELTLGDTLRFGAMLGAQGAFDGER